MYFFLISSKNMSWNFTLYFRPNTELPLRSFTSKTQVFIIDTIVRDNQFPVSDKQGKMQDCFRYSNQIKVLYSIQYGILRRETILRRLYISILIITSFQILKDTVKAIGNIVSCKTHIQRVIGYGIVPKLVSLLSHEEAQVQTGALEALGNLVSGTAEEAQSVMDSGVLSHIPALLYHKVSALKTFALKVFFFTLKKISW